MIESYENTLQIAVLFVCALVALSRAARQRSREWTLLAFFYGSWLLGDSYWLLCLVFFGEPARVSVVSDMSWFAAFFFLYLLLRQAAPLPEGNRTRRLLPWLGYVFTASMAVFFMRWGKIVSNLVYAALLGTLLYAVFRRLENKKHHERQTLLCTVVLVACLLEYALWTASCFWWEETLRNPYYWCDLLLTACFPFFLGAVKKAVAE